MEDLANVKVFCRFRPLNSKEIQISQNCCANFINDKTISISQQYENAEPLKFTFDSVFTPEASQELVYEIAARPIVNAVMEGFNGTVFAYGQTSSGKTFTMTGPDFEDPEMIGIIPRMVTTVFDEICSADECIEFSVKVSYCEIYLEKIKDLLDTSKNDLKIREDRTRGIYIDGITEQYVSDDKDVYDLMKIGIENREVAYTNMNSGSSRSHSLFLLTIGQTNSKDLSGKIGKLYLVDLAGSEKVNKTGAAGKRLEEAKNINKSLTVLGQVINSLTDGKSTHIPYRDSKLTRVLQDSLGGNSKTSLIVTCSPSPYNESETISTLRFGVRAKSIKNKPKVNKEYTIAELKLMLAKYQEEIDKRDKIILSLEDNLKKIGGKIPDVPILNQQKTDNKVDYDEIISEIEDLKNRLSEEVENNKSGNETIQKLLIEIQEIKADKDSLIYQMSNYQEKVISNEKNLKEYEDLIEKLVITKETLESDNNQILKMKLSMEQLINEKDLEINELKLHSSSNTQRSSVVYDLRSQLEYEKERNQDLAKKTIELEDNLKQTMDLINNNSQNLNETVIKQYVEREKKLWNEERKAITRDLKNRINKVIELEIALDNAKENYEALETTLSLGERKLKQKVDLLSKNLEQLTFMYQQLLNEKSTKKVDIKILEKKNFRLVERISGLETELKKANEMLVLAQSRVKMFEDDQESNQFYRNSVANTSRSGRFSVVRKIKGGGGNNVSKIEKA